MSLRTSGPATLLDFANLISFAIGGVVRPGAVGHLYQTPSPRCRPDATVPHDSGTSIRDYMMQQQPMPKAEKPKFEPEIIPPSADWPHSSQIWVSTGPHHTTRIQITRLGSAGIALFVLLIGILALAGLVLLLGAALVGVVAAGLLIGRGIFSSLSRRAVRR
jgi:hypothetical protein